MFSLRSNDSTARQLRQAVIKSASDDSTEALPILPAPRIAVLNNQQDLAGLNPGFTRALSDEFDLATLSGRLCPVLLDDGTVAIFALPEYAAADQVDEIERMIIQQGYRLAHPSRYLLAAPLLLAVARGQITGALLRSQRKTLFNPQQSALSAIFHNLVAWGVRHGASDIHLNVWTQQAESEVRYTINGQYVVPEQFQRMPTATLLEILAVAWMSVRGGNGAVFDPLIEQQGRIRQQVDNRPIMLRWASLATDSGPSVCLRILCLDIQPESDSLASLGYLPQQIEALERARLAEGGAIVLAGVVGSGKSTTIATLMRGVAPTRKVITLEDPVEYIIPNALQNTVGRALDEDSVTAFDAKLKTLKRSAMNDLLIGEIRDAETGRAFMDLAGSGVSVYTTTHTGSAVMIPERLASDFIGISRDFLATPGVLKLLVYQALLPKLCPSCSLPLESLYEGALDADGILRDGHWWHVWVSRFLRIYQLDVQSIHVRNPQGCSSCRQPQLPQLYGFKGRTVAAEMFEPSMDDIFLDCIRHRDNLRLRRHAYRPLYTVHDQPNIIGISALDCAVYKASIGQIDPRYIESRFSAFSTVDRQRQTECASASDTLRESDD